jgi:PAS domain-containing protein
VTPAAPWSNAPAPAKQPQGLSVPNASSVREALALFWESPFPASLQGPDFRTIDVNQAMLDYTGYTREQLVGQDPQALMPPEDQAVYACKLAPAMSTNPG